MEYLRRLCIILIVSILFLSSCGIPSYHEFSDAVSVSSVSYVPGVATNYDAGFRVTIRWDSDENLSFLDSVSPSVLLMYSIAPGSDSLSSYFNRNIRSSNNYYNGVAASFDSAGRLNNVEGSLNGNTVNLYAFRGQDGRSLSTAASYTFSPLDSSSSSWYFMIRRIEGPDNGFHFEMDVYSQQEDGTYSSQGTIPLYRYSGTNSTFYLTAENDALSQADYSYYAEADADDDLTYSIYFYLAVNLVPGSGAGFNNIYWSSLSYDSVDA